METAPVAAEIDWQRLFDRAAARLLSSDIRELLAVTSTPNVISFAGGLPAPELFPTADLAVAVERTLSEHGTKALQYGPTEGDAELREWLAGRLNGRGMECHPDDILITTGSQQGLDLLGKALGAPDTPLLVEQPAYVGALQALAASSPRFVPFEMDEQGLDVEALGAWLGRARGRGDDPSLIYTVATFQNPSGRTMSVTRRRRLIELSRTFGVPLVEDDPYSDLRYAGQPVPALRALPDGDQVVYLGTFSKIVAPGLRIGWVLAPRPLIRRLVLAKQGTDLHTDALAQRTVLRYCLDFDLDAHIEKLRAAYGARRDAMLDALRSFMPAGTRWTEPEGGMFVWLTLATGIDTRALLAEAMRRDVAYVPGSAFHVDGGGANELRLNFTNATPERIRTGVARLAQAIEAHLAAAGG